MTPKPAQHPEPPYYVVIFTATLTEDLEGYAETAARMRALASAVDGYLGFEATQEGEAEIALSYWRDLDAIAAWKRQLDHLQAQRLGRARWYAGYRVRIARVERDYAFPAA